MKKDVSDWRFGGVCQVGLIMVCFMTCTFKGLHGQQPAVSGRNALSWDKTGNTRFNSDESHPNISPAEAKVDMIC